MEYTANVILTNTYNLSYRIDSFLSFSLERNLVTSKKTLKNNFLFHNSKFKLHPFESFSNCISSLQFLLYIRQTLYHRSTTPKPNSAPPSSMHSKMWSKRTYACPPKKWKEFHLISSAYKFPNSIEITIRIMENVMLQWFYAFLPFSSLLFVRFIC